MTKLDIFSLHPYMYNRPFNVNDNVMYKKNIKKKKQDERDVLFFFVYSKINNKYPDLLFNYNNSIEKQEKVKMTEQLDKIKFKNKVKILDNLLYEEKINLRTFGAICNYFDLNIIYINDWVYYKMISNNDTDIIFIDKDFHEIESMNYSNLYEINDIEKPLKSISYYKVDELKGICDVLSLTYDKLKKKEIYDLIYDNLLKLKIFIKN